MIKCIKFFLFSASLFLFQQLIGQGKIIDKAACEQWVSLKDFNGSSSILSNNGNYVAFKFGSPSGGSKMIVRQVDGQFNMEFEEPVDAQFSLDSKYFVALLPGDRLLVMKLADRAINYVDEVKQFHLAGDGRNALLVYLNKGQERKLVVQNFTTNKRDSSLNIDRF